LLQLKGLEIIRLSNPSNFREAKEAILTGIKIERDAVDNKRSISVTDEKSIKQVIDEWVKDASYA